MKKSVVLLLIFLSLFSVSVFAEEVMDVSLVIDDGKVSGNIILIDDEPSSYSGSGDYELKVLDSGGSVLWSQNFELSYMYNQSLGSMPFDMLGYKVPYNVNMFELKLFKKGNNIFSKQLNFCNNNGVCDYNSETHYSCPNDCSLGVSSHNTDGAVSIDKTISKDSQIRSIEGMEHDGDFIWAPEPSYTTNAKVYKVDDDTGSVVSSYYQKYYTVHVSNVVGLAYDHPNSDIFNYVYPYGPIYAVDASSPYPETRKFSVPGAWLHDIAFDGTYLWAVRGDSMTPNYNVYKLNANNGAVIKQFNSPLINGVPSAPGGITFDGQNIWISSSGYLFQIDQNKAIADGHCENAILRKYSTPVGGRIAWDGTRLWTQDGTHFYRLKLPTLVTITEIIPIQVVKDVDLVKDKSGIIRVKVKNNGNEAVTATVSASIEGGDVSNSPISKSIGGSAEEQFDFRFIPRQEGQKTITITLQNPQGTITKTKQVKVVKTRDLSILYSRLGTVNEGWFYDTINRENDFIKRVYPIKDSGLKYFSYLSNPIFDSILRDASLTNDGKLQKILKTVAREGTLSFFNYASVITPVGFLPAGTTGLTKTSIDGAGFAQVNVLGTTSHEMGHKLGLCDETSESAWKNQSTQVYLWSWHLLSWGCPNARKYSWWGFTPDPACFPNGCVTNTIQPLSNQPDNTVFYNFMGQSGVRRWVSSDSYNRLLENLKSGSPKKFLLVSGDVVLKENGLTEVELDSSYIIDESVTSNQEFIAPGDFYLQTFDASNNLLSNISFDPFIVLYDNGDLDRIDSNKGSFVFVLPFASSPEVNRVIVMEKEEVKVEQIRTEHAPVVTVTSPNGGESYYEDFVVSWIAYDEDNDKLHYSVLVSDDDGNTWGTLAMDLEDTSYLVDISDLPDSPKYLIKVLVTDGINTGDDVSDSTFAIDRSPYKFKLGALNKLKAMKTGKKCSMLFWWLDKDCVYEHRIDKAIYALESSLNREYWVDDYTLNSKWDSKVFDYEKEAVEELMAIER